MLDFSQAADQTGGQQVLTPVGGDWAQKSTPRSDLGYRPGPQPQTTGRNGQGPTGDDNVFGLAASSLSVHQPPPPAQRISGNALSAPGTGGLSLSAMNSSMPSASSVGGPGGSYYQRPAGTPGYMQQQPINVEEAQRNFESSVVEMDAGRYDAAPFGWNLAICECAPLAAQPQQNTGTPRTGAAKVLNDAVLYQLLPSSQRNRIRLR